MSTLDTRNIRLNALFSSILHGKANIAKANHQQFIEAIYTQSNPASSLKRIVSSPKGLDSIQAAMRIDMSPPFLNGHAAKLLNYMSEPDLALIGGDLLRHFILALVEPPIFWDAFVTAFKDGHLQQEAQLGFAWLLLQLVTARTVQTSSYIDLASDPSIINVFEKSPVQAIRTIGARLSHVAHMQQSNVVLEEAMEGPGGRHDNDKVNFRDIAILPTADELTSKEAPFLRPNSVVERLEGPDRMSGYLDNQFRLLREDFLCELRDDLKIALGKKNRSSRNLQLEGLKLLDVHYQPSEDSRTTKATGWGISLKCHDFIPAKVKKRKEWLQENARVLRHGALSALLVGNEIVAFPTIYRDLDLLARKPPIVVLRLEGDASISTALLKLKISDRIRLLPMDTAVFAYAPILKGLQDATSVPLADELLFWSGTTPLRNPLLMPSAVLDSLRDNPSQDLRTLLKLKNKAPVVLDRSQSTSLLAGLEQTVSLIQGPPGTGKSFIGALLAKALHDYTNVTIHVVCYTNHALDQFLEDLLSIGIPSSSMIRLGGKSTKLTESVSLHNIVKAQPRSNFSRQDWGVVNFLKQTAARSDNALKRASDAYMALNPDFEEIMAHLEFEEPEYFQAFTVPALQDGMEVVTKSGKKVGRTYLWHQWRNGWNAGVLREHPEILDASQIWEMSREAREAKIQEWKEALLKEIISHIQDLVPTFNNTVAELDRKFSESKATVIASRRIIACTTTAAAMYRNEILKAKPAVLLVEEAGEILESHILTAMSESTQQLILIGDHKQLRPKVNNFKLTVEKGEGYDLNRSLFERLVLKKYPHQTLTRQHRMRPQISDLIRHLTYRDLEDADVTKTRPDVRGVRDNVMFIHHEHPEDSLKEDPDASDAADSRTASKTNLHEVEMVLKIVRYLGQQGYGTDKIVILTPYLGQLRALQNALKTTTDPILNDLDAADLVRYGLVSEADAKIAKTPIRLATIDNYQGEESDIVIASLTRSNSDHKIGFMASPERVNVLLSRAKVALIMLGNAHTFQRGRQGGQVWVPLLEKLRNGGHVYDGFPTRCERHPDRIAILETPLDFDEKTPDGGCTRHCGAKLPCGHDCPSKCHQISDHSKMPCDLVMHGHCDQGHNQQWRCRDGPPDSCRKCKEAHAAAEQKKQEEFKRQQRKEREQRGHDLQMAKIEDEIRQVREALNDTKLAEDRKTALLQRRDDLKKLLAKDTSLAPVSHTLHDDHTTPTSSAGQESPPNQKLTASARTGATVVDGSNGSPADNLASAGTAPVSSAREEWERQKRVNSERNDAIDAIMDLVGLEGVKTEVLTIKARVETAKRQGTTLKDVRLNVAMLGNPGTGKTTVARLYACFLETMDVLPGSEFYSTTGSRLANDGVPAVKTQLAKMLQEGGGTVFVDEAYQLTTDQPGKKVLEFLLTEMEDNTGKLVFIFAGYNTEMERFFEHNPGLNSRIPHRFQFQDYDDSELLDMLEDLLVKKFKGMMKVDDNGGIRGLFGRIAVRRLGRGRGKAGFGNARALQNLFDRICARQAFRLDAGRRRGERPNDFVIIKEDLIGPAPSDVMASNPAYKKLMSLIGLEDVKESINNLIGTVTMNYERELKELIPHELSLNRVFIGNPGTGKTTVAKLYGQILADFGFLSSGEVIVKNPSDFIGSVLGQSESQTKAILSNAVGKVLVVDEAYMLNPAANGNSGDPYRNAVIDTFVAEIQSVPGEDRCVLLLGYKEMMEEMFRTVNPGLSRRFPIEDAFVFKDYTDIQLRQALDWKLSSQDLSATEPAKSAALEFLARLRNRPNFGNIGAVENLLTTAKGRYQARQSRTRPEHRSATAPFEPEDFDPEFDRAMRASSNLAKLFEDVVNCDGLVTQFESYQRLVSRTKATGIDSRDLVPMTFVFKGPPGTGKTTTARKVGQIYYDMGMLSSSEVVECSASDLVGQYVGHTGPKTRGLFEKALGRVLFIDEAYRLSVGQFAKEAMDELVGILTDEKFRGKLIVIIAGYDAEMEHLLSVNPGLSSRFSTSIDFAHIPPSDCLEIMNRALRKFRVTMGALEDPASPAYSRMILLIEELSSLPSWGNARDMQTLSKEAATVALTNSTEACDPSGVVRLSDQMGISLAEAMLKKRRAQAQIATVAIGATSDNSQVPASTAFKEGFAMPSAAIMPSIQRSQGTDREAEPSSEHVTEVSETKADEQRDAGVSDADWYQLQADKAAEERARLDQEEKLQEAQRNLAMALQEEEASKRVHDALAAGKCSDDADDDEGKRRLEEARLKELKAKAERGRLQAALKAKREEADRKRREEIRVQTKLRQLGVCPVGYRWIKQSHGYRCAGGSHFVENAGLGL